VLVSGFPGAELPLELRRAAGRGELGGFVLFARNLGDMQQTAELNASLRAACPEGAPPWIALDQEGGRVQRLGPPVLQLPPMGRLGALDDADLSERIARTLGQQLAALGFNMNFAPVLDVDTNPDNPVIGDRSFGSEPERVIRHGRAFARGLAAAGVAACGKHFPGHGDTLLDSHLALPRLHHDMQRLRRVELAPFAALAGELGAIMTAHVIFDALDPERPATLSATVIDGLLRQELGFTGLVFSDDLEMKAIADHKGVPEAACEAVAAGCDALLICSQPGLVLEAHAALCARAAGDRAFAQRLERAAERGLRARLKHPARMHRDPAIADIALDIAAELTELLRR